MRKSIIFILLLAMTGILIACGSDQKKEAENGNDQLIMLDVQFDVPETAEPNETVTLTATVTYGDEPVTDPSEVLFEIWKVNHKDDGEKIEPTNNKDGTYSLEYVFKEDGVYEMFAHTTAEGMHIMPKKQVIVGDAEESNTGSNDTQKEDEHVSTEGFEMHFTEPEKVNIDSEVELTTHLLMNDMPLEEVGLRYEIFPDGNEDAAEWVDAEEVNKGQYTGTYTFMEPGNYTVQIHVKDDADLHEHTMEHIEVQNN